MRRAGLLVGPCMHGLGRWRTREAHASASSDGGMLQSVECNGHASICVCRCCKRSLLSRVPVYRILFLMIAQVGNADRIFESTTLAAAAGANQ